MKRFIAVVKRTPGITDDIVAPYATREAERFKQLIDSGLIYDYYRQIDAGNFWLIIHSPSQEEALAQLQTFPYFGLGYISINLTELADTKITR